MALVNPCPPPRPPAPQPRHLVQLPSSRAPVRSPFSQKSEVVRCSHLLYLFEPDASGPAARGSGAQRQTPNDTPDPRPASGGEV